MINYFKRTIKGRSIKNISWMETDSWINVVNPSPKEKNYLKNKYGFIKEH